MCHLPMNAVWQPAFCRYCGKNTVPGGGAVVVVNHLVIVRVQPSENRGATGRAQGRCHERVLIVDAAAGQRVDVRRLQERMAHEREGVETQIVHEDEDHVARFAVFEPNRIGHVLRDGNTSERRQGAPNQ